ncbi:rhodanese-like domain-containing protein [Sulfurovum sp. XGS-02]|uniref:rhodanese-like domain-containing protein n=1 Tax=Sulfurovum sp. XGS-02 TaxID=2925411 RepID=UPI00206D891F|nr:rhodanese-like domain-containing protein [Sulfurovum sp. XGS-02]UPT78585.1 rhodanese-like domain-containing protein [Sulfurovum sp. XGS-02]
MKKTFLLLLVGYTTLFAETQALHYDDYLSTFTYEERKEMKINSVELSVMLEEDTAQLVDIRFKEEYEAWHMPASINIPLNELPKRLNELDKSKLIVTACPHKDRAIMARTFLKLKGYNTRYLVDGLLGLAEFLRGDNAREFIQEYHKIMK